ncbi:FBXO11 [Branchiostoma lanceolatum]|uniref:FBXO11 protein n=1 Tax=Branchiostoma lanceolatum TaxID=7740 RepID=A0A8J9ZI13_BRALA|nr:FBXO11 [Branchiostoma lanceolatum]
MAASRRPKSGRQTPSKVSIQLPDLTVPFQPRTVAVNNSNTAGNAAAFDLREAEKEHLVVGCCLHRIITPPLRKYVKSTMQKSYRKMKSSDQIQTQTFPNYIKYYKGHRLNYRNINNNNRHKAAEDKYDYRVSNNVDFAKLFLQPFMAHMTGFDDSCDMSALLGLLCQVGDFSQDVKEAAFQVQREVRNKWAHCDFSNWTRPHFLRSFQLMDMLVKSLKLPSSAEQKCMQELMDWEQRGVQLILGQVIDKDLLRVVQQDVAEMQSNLVKYKESSESEVEKLVEQLKGMKKVLAQTEEKFEQEQATLRRDVAILGDSITETEDRVTTLEGSHWKLAEQVLSLEDREANVEKEVSAVAEKVEDIDRSLTDFQQSQTNVDATVAAEQEVHDKRLRTLERGQVKFEQRVDSVESWQKEVSESLAKLQITEDSEARKPAQGFFKIPDRNKWFSGRQKELKDLDERFQISEPSRISNKKLAICGLGGCGKTSLAIEYSWRFQETYQGGIYWMSAENNRTFEISLNDVALDIGTVGSNFDDTLTRTTAWLSSLQEPWLLIVDNMDEFDISSEVHKLLEGHWKQTSKGHILITTRREAVEMMETMGFERDNCIGLLSMSEDESCAFLLKRTQQEEQPGMRDLASELGGLPLALEQAAAHINVLECAFEVYLKQYKQQKLKLLKRRKVKAITSTTDKDRMAVHTTWLLNFQHIQKCEDPKLAEAACAMMNIAAYLDPDDIPIELVNKGDPCVSQLPLEEYAKSPLGSKQIFEVLTQFSLLQRCQASNGKRGCKDFPSCQGGPGCVNDTTIPCAETNQNPRAFAEMHGEFGYPGFQALRGTLYADHCSIIDCGGGGLLVDGEESHAVVINCDVVKNTGSGLEVRNGGTLEATGNNIHNNRLHGVLTGPGASNTHVVGNHIHNNFKEGVLVYQSSVITIGANRIDHNDASGISVDSSTVDLHDNEIGNNWHWGLFLKTHSSANICRNLVHLNKAGGLRFGFNQFGRVLIDENVIRDHTGPAIYIIPNLNKESTQKRLKVVPKELEEPFIVPPIITDRNVYQRNDTKQQHPSTAFTHLPVGCAFCGDQHKKTTSCRKCDKARYCSRGCELEHWQRHKIICVMIQSDYSFKVSTEDTIQKWAPPGYDSVIRTFNAELKGIKQGTPPDKTGRRRFIVKIQSGAEYQRYNPDSNLTLYDQTTTLDLLFRNSQLYHIIMECGVLGTNQCTSKKIFCYAKMEDNGKYVRIYTDHLAPLQEW